MRPLPAALLSAAALAGAAIHAAGPSPAARGREIYLRGASLAGGEVVAVMAGDVAVPAATVPCAGCHGRDGRGRPEGGLTPSDITWEALTKPYGVTHPGGRTHPPYTERSLKRAIALGLDPAGQALHAAMPRFRLSQEDMADLVAYLKVVGSEAVPGVSDGAVRLGVLPPPGPGGAAVEAALRARFAEVNAEGGIYGRRLELVAAPVQAPDTPAARRDRAAAFLDAEPVLALAGASFGGAEAELAALFEEREVPVLGAVSLRPPHDPSGRWVFYLLSGLEDQARALVEIASSPLPGAPAGERPAPPVLLASDDPALRPVAAALEEAGTSVGTPVESLRYPPGALAAGELARKLKDAGAGSLVFAGPGADLARLLAAADGIGWHPRVFALGALAAPAAFAAPRGFAGRIFLAFPALPLDPGSSGGATYARLAAAASLPRHDLQAQAHALAAAELAIEALRRAGRDLTRERLVQEVENFRQFATGYLSPLTYGAGRRRGARGAYLLAVDLEKQTFTPAGGWIEAR